MLHASQLLRHQQRKQHPWPHRDSFDEIDSVLRGDFAVFEVIYFLIELLDKGGQG